MKKLLLTACLFICLATANAQGNFNTAIAIPFSSGALPKKIIQTSDQGYLIGASASTSGVMLFKTNDLGTITWAKALALPTSYGSMDDLGERAGGGYYILCEGYDSLWAQMTYWVTVTDAAGNIQWSKGYPTQSFSYITSKIKQMADGGYVISESLYSKMGMLRLDANGNQVWNYSFTADSSEYGKNPSFDCLILNDGSTVTTGKRTNDICLVKADPNGNTVWVKTMTNGYSYYHANAIAQTSTGDLLIGGYEDYAPFLMKTDASGNILWYKHYAGSNNALWSIDKIMVQASGNLTLMCGDGYSSSSFIVTDPSGNPINAFSYGNGTSTMLTSASSSFTSDGGMVIAGSYSNSQTSVSGMVIFKMDPFMPLNCESSSFIATITPSPYGPPSVIAVPFYHIAEADLSFAATISASNLVTLQEDFCQLFSTNDPAGIEASVNVFPNPTTANGMLHLQISGAQGDVVVSVMDATGKLVAQQNAAVSNGSIIDISTENFGSGLYFVRITDNNSNRIADSKFIVE